MDMAAAFENQAQSCINRTSNDDFENCLKIMHRCCRPIGR